jgi:hypothetical protein
VVVVDRVGVGCLAVGPRPPTGWMLFHFPVCASFLDKRDRSVLVPVVAPPVRSAVATSGVLDAPQVSRFAWDVTCDDNEQRIHNAKNHDTTYHEVISVWPGALQGSQCVVLGASNEIGRGRESYEAVWSR